MLLPHRPQQCSFCSWHTSIATPPSKEKVKLVAASLKDNRLGEIVHIWPTSSCQLNHTDLSRDWSYAVYSKPVLGSRIKQQLCSLLAWSQAHALQFKGCMRLKQLTYTLKHEGKSLPCSQVSPASCTPTWSSPKKVTLYTWLPNSNHVISLEHERQQPKQAVLGAAPLPAPEQQHAPQVS